MCELDKSERVTGFCRVRDFAADKYVVLATAEGIIKKTSLDAFSNPRKAGVNAMNIPDSDELIEAAITDGSYEIVLATRKGMAIRFPEDKIRPMTRSAYGVKGITLAMGDRVIGMVAVGRDSSLLVVTENGYGKRTSIEDYRMTNRGGKGVINVKTSERNGEVVVIKEVLDSDELILITNHGIANRQAVSQIKVIGRNTQGVRLINLGKGDKVTDVARVVAEAD
jgi:DNA gyrase subunit A